MTDPIEEAVARAICVAIGNDPDELTYINMPSDMPHVWRLYIPEARAAVDAAVKRMQDATNGAYAERNKIVRLLASIYPSGIKKTAIEGWDEEWHWCVYIDLPNGQASWHFHVSDRPMFDGLPPYKGEWDGHTTDEKYERLLQLAYKQNSEVKRMQDRIAELEETNDDLKGTISRVSRSAQEAVNANIKAKERIAELERENEELKGLLEECPIQSEPINARLFHSQQGPLAGIHIPAPNQKRV